MEVGLTIGRLGHGLTTSLNVLPILAACGGTGVGSIDASSVSRFRVQLGVKC